MSNQRSGSTETAAARIDMGDWMASLPSRDREIASALGVGEQTRDVARRFKVFAGRISQMRREFAESWEAFQGEGVGA